MRSYRLANLDLPRWPGSLLILLVPAVAHAHAGGSDTGLINGLMHPVFGLDHLLAMISVGVVSAQRLDDNQPASPAGGRPRPGSGRSVTHVTAPFPGWARAEPAWALPLNLH